MIANPTSALRPKLWPYALIVAGLAVVWIIYQLLLFDHPWRPTDFEGNNMGNGLRYGLLIIVGAGALAFFGHWIYKASATENSPSQPVPTPAHVAAVSSVNADVEKVLSGVGPKYALEIRSIGLAIKGAHQDSVWKQIQDKANNYDSILSQDAKDYGENPGIRKTLSEVATTAAFSYAASEAVHYWPIPVIILGPPVGEQATIFNRAASGIVEGRNAAGLGVTEFLWLDDHNTTSASSAITELFHFFDTHPDVPAALILSQDGMRYRWGVTPGTPPEPSGPFVPPVPDSMAGLLVARTDRVDSLVRPFVVNVPTSIDKTATQYDVIKLWNFYWDKNQQFADEAGKPSSDAGTMRADWWTSQLPELWKQIDNKGPGDFKPSPYLPVRWTNWQVEQFDAAPRLGYLHRPVEVRITTGDGTRLKRQEEVQRLQDGWKQAVATLPDGAKPARVFYDTTTDREWVIPLSQALHDNVQGVDIGEVREGYDIGRRIGNTGVSSALVQICLATIAGYEDGSASATVNLVDGKSASIVMVSPPDAASKAINERNRGQDPFRYR
jgi:hypothetical protein